MKAFTIDRYKSKDGGRIVDLPQPEVGDNDVLVQIHAAGVNLLDAKIADGEFKIFLPYRFPLVLGNDVAGVVVQVGARVRRFKPGDEVYARPDKDRIGTFAEFIPHPCWRSQYRSGRTRAGHPDLHCNFGGVGHQQARDDQRAPGGLTGGPR